MRNKLEIDFDEIGMDERQPKPIIEDFKQELFQELENESVDEEDDEVTESFNSEDPLPFASTIRGLLYVYGDQQRPKDEVVMQVHLQIQELSSALFSKDIIAQLIKLSKRKSNPNDLYILSDEDQPDQPYVITNQQKFRAIFSKYLSSVFHEFKRSFQVVDHHIGQVKKKLCSEESISNRLTYKQAIPQGRKQQEYNKPVYSDSDRSIFEDAESPRQASEASSHESSELAPPVPNHQGWEQYLHDKIDKMNMREFDRFMNLRSKTFISRSRKKLIEFLDTADQGESFQKALGNELRFINYCLCRVIRQLVVHCFKSRSEHFELLREDVTQQGNRIVKRYMDRAKKFSLTRTKVQLMAYNVFEREYVSEGFINLESKKIRLQLHDTGITINTETVDPMIKKAWRNLPIENRRMWIDRVMAEKHLKDVVLKQRKVKPPNKYFDYLWERFKGSKSSLSSCATQLRQWFKEWYIGIGR